MKKTLLLLSFAAVASMASAQTVVGLATDEQLANAGFAKDKATLGPITFVDNEAGTFGTAYEDSWGSSTIYKGYQNVTVDGEAITLGSGAVGNANPTFVSYEAGVMSAGAVFVLHANKDGWMTVFTKINPNKQYLVFEGKKGALSYSLGYSNGTDKIYYTTPHDADYQIDFNAADINKFMVPATKQSKNAEGVPLWKNKVTGEIVAAEKNPTVKGDDNQQYQAVNEEIPGENKPQFPYLIAGYEKAPSESTGFMTFSVMADNDYYISALGSKACMGGFVYTENEPTITFCATDALPEVTFAAGENPGDPVEALDIYLRGDMNEWGTEDAWKFKTTDGNLYTLANVTIKDSQKFKIADATWGDINYGVEDSSDKIQPNTEKVLTYNGKDMYLTESVENATIEFNLAEKTMKVVTGNSVGAISVDGQKAVYYNLQGVQVANPVEGNIYIVKKGAKVVKKAF